MLDDKRRLYGIEGSVGYLIADTSWSTGANLNVLKTELKVNGQWRKYDVKTVSPSKATTYISRAPDEWVLRLQSTTSFGLSVENLLAREYSTVWGQRAPLHYSPGYGPASLYDYQVVVVLSG